MKIWKHSWILFDLFQPLLNQPLSGLLVICGNTFPYDLSQVPLKDTTAVKYTDTETKVAKLVEYL